MAAIVTGVLLLLLSLQALAQQEDPTEEVTTTTTTTTTGEDPTEEETTTTTTTTGEEQCDIECRVWEEPVCAQNSDGEISTFFSECYMDAFNCKHKKNYTVVNDSVCENPWTAGGPYTTIPTTTQDEVEVSSPTS